MTNNKNFFDESSSTYDEYSKPQQHASHVLIALIRPYLLKGVSILDCGCGTGVTTKIILNNLETASVYAIDLSEPSLHAFQKKKYTQDVFYCAANILYPPFKPNSFDLIIANLSLHWTMNLEYAISALCTVLRHGGWLAFSLPLIGNFPELRPEHRMKCHKQGEIENISYRQSLALVNQHQERYKIHFESYKDALLSLKKTGVNQGWQRNRLHKKKAKYFFIENAPPTLTYHFGYFILRKT